MAGITSALCTSFKVELLEGDHDFNNGADAFKVALFKANASITGTYSAATTNYSDMTGNSDELPNGSGYTTTGLIQRQVVQLLLPILVLTHHGLQQHLLHVVV